MLGHNSGWVDLERTVFGDQADSYTGGLLNRIEGDKEVVYVKVNYFDFDKRLNQGTHLLKVAVGLSGGIENPGEYLDCLLKKYCFESSDYEIKLKYGLIRDSGSNAYEKPVWMIESMCGKVPMDVELHTIKGEWVIEPLKYPDVLSFA
jgi:hypothetical protein